MKYLIKKVLLTMAALVLSGCGKDRESKDLESQSNSHSYDEDPLLQSEAWLQFKAFWRKLNAISPSEDNTLPEIPYAYAISIEEYQNLEEERLEIHENLRSLNLRRTGWDFQIELLMKICDERLHTMHQPNMLVTRMMPSSFQIRHHQSIEALEPQLDLFMDLRRSNAIDTEEFTQAMENLEREISLTYLLDSMDHYWFWDDAIETEEISQEEVLQILRAYIAEREESQGEPSEGEQELIGDLNRGAEILEERISQWNSHREALYFLLYNLEN